MPFFKSSSSDHSTKAGLGNNLVGPTMREVMNYPFTKRLFEKLKQQNIKNMSDLCAWTGKFTKKEMAKSILKHELSFMKYLNETSSLVLNDYATTQLERAPISQEDAIKQINLWSEYYCNEGYIGRRHFIYTITNLQCKYQLMKSFNPEGLKLSPVDYRSTIRATISQVEQGKRLTGELIDENHLSIIRLSAYPFLKQTLIEPNDNLLRFRFEKKSVDDQIDILQNVHYLNPLLGIKLYDTLREFFNKKQDPAPVATPYPYKWKSL